MIWFDSTLGPSKAGCSFPPWLTIHREWVSMNGATKILFGNNNNNNNNNINNQNNNHNNNNNNNNNNKNKNYNYNYNNKNEVETNKNNSKLSDSKFRWINSTTISMETNQFMSTNVNMGPSSMMTSSSYVVRKESSVVCHQIVVQPSSQEQQQQQPSTTRIILFKSSGWWVFLKYFPKWKPLNVKDDIIWLTLSNWPSPQSSSIKYFLYLVCYHSCKVRSLTLTQNDHFGQFTLQVNIINLKAIFFGLLETLPSFKLSVKSFLFYFSCFEVVNYRISM